VRALIEENHAAILKNYAAVYTGNRQLINANRAIILKNRMIVLSNLQVENDVQLNFKNSMINEANIEFMEIQAKVDMRSLEVSDLLSKANALLIEANMKIMEKNADLVAFNQKNISINAELIEAGISPEKATAKSNATRIASNLKRITALEKIALRQSEAIAVVSEKVLANRKKNAESSLEIEERRKAILENRAMITKNRRRQNILSMIG